MPSTPLAFLQRIYPHSTSCTSVSSDCSIANMFEATASNRGTDVEIEQPVAKDVHSLPVRRVSECATQQNSYLLYRRKGM
jgi:hypothetical protein